MSIVGVVCPLRGFAQLFWVNLCIIGSKFVKINGKYGKLWENIEQNLKKTLGHWDKYEWNFSKIQEQLEEKSEIVRFTADKVRKSFLPSSCRYFL